MKIISGNNIGVCLAHGKVMRKKLVSVGDSKSKVQTVNDAWLERSQGFENDYHKDCEEYYYFLEGKGEMKIDDKVFVVSAGDFVIIEPKEYHSLKNTSSEKLRWISIRISI